jgi:transposase
VENIYALIMENTKSVHGFPDWTELKMLFSGKLSLNEEMFIIMRIQKYQPLDAAAEGLKSWLKKHDYKIEGAYKWTQLAKERAAIVKKK